MGFFDRLTGRQRVNESVKIVANNDDEQGLHYNPKDVYNDQSDILNMNEINKFRLLSNKRSEKFNSFDLMGQDSRVASILNMYADDCTQYNQSSSIIWAESADPDCADFVNKLIDELQLNKNAWSHIYSLCKYGDLYLQLFYTNESDIDRLATDDRYSRTPDATLTNHIEMVKNPAEIFDLVRHGKTEFYVKIHDDKTTFNAPGDMNHLYDSYKYLESDIVLPADKFVHISLNDSHNRYPTQYILKDTETDKEKVYDVKEGNSILANVFKVWSELNLLEDSVLLNRLSKSAIIRLIQIEVGNTDDDEVHNILQTLRDKISRSRYFDKNSGDYKNQVNPGPLENIIYHATHKGNGAITHSTIGGDVDVKALADIDLFLEKFAQSFPIPLAYVRQKNDDGGGLSAGTSLTKFDARYGRTLKRIQTAYIYGITDLINVFAYKRNLPQYINEFNIKMVSPSAVEDNERDEKLTAHTTIIRDIMDVIDKIEEGYDTITRKKILNYLIQTMLQDIELNDILQEDMQNTIEKEKDNLESSDENSDDNDLNNSFNNDKEEEINL